MNIYRDMDNVPHRREELRRNGRDTQNEGSPLGLPSSSAPAVDRQYSDEFEEPIVPFAAENEDNGDEPSISNDGSRLLEDLINTVGPMILPYISSSEDESGGEYKRDSGVRRGRTDTLRQRRPRSNSGEAAHLQLQNFPPRRVPVNSHHTQCGVCGRSYSNPRKLDLHLQQHARADAVDSDTDHDDEISSKLFDHIYHRQSGPQEMDIFVDRPVLNDMATSAPPPSGTRVVAVQRSVPTDLMDIPRDITNLIFDYLHPMEWTRSCGVVNKLFWSVTQFKWGRVDIYALQGLSLKKRYGEEYRAEFLGKYATRLKTLIIENCGIEAKSFITLTENLRRLQVLVLEWSPRILMNSVPPLDAPASEERSRTKDEEDDDGADDEDVVMSDVVGGNETDHSVMDVDEAIRWDELDTFSGQLRVVIVRGIGPHISSSAFEWLLGNSHNSLNHLTISRKDPTRCQRPGCGACTLWKFQACAQCKMATYCSRRCQKRHWRNHKCICQDCAKSPKDRMVFDDTLLNSIIQCTNLIRLDLSRTFRLDDKRLVLIAAHCTKLIDVSLDGNHHISDRGVEPFVRLLPKLHTLRLNVCSRIGNQTVVALSQTCADHLTVLELGCCYRVSETALMDLVVTCTKLQSLNIACGFQRRQILWNFSDELVDLILDHLVHLKVLYVVSTISLSDEARRKLDNHPNLRVYSALTLAPPLDPHRVHVAHPDP